MFGFGRSSGSPASHPRDADIHSNGPSLFSGVSSVTASGAAHMTGDSEALAHLATMTLRRQRELSAKSSEGEALQWHPFDLPIMVSFNPADMSESDGLIEIVDFKELLTKMEKAIKGNNFYPDFPRFLRKDSLLGDVTVHSVTNSSYMSFLGHLSVEDYEREFPTTIVQNVGNLRPANVYLPLECKGTPEAVVRHMDKAAVGVSWLAQQFPGIPIESLMDNVREARDQVNFYVRPDNPVVEFIDDMLLESASQKVPDLGSEAYKEELRRLRKTTFGVERIDKKGNDILVRKTTFMTAKQKLRDQNAENLTLGRFLANAKMTLFRAFRTANPFSKVGDNELDGRFPEQARDQAYGRRVTVTFIVRMYIGYLP